MQAKCKEKALNQIANGSAVEFQVAGQCGLGVLDAARSKKVFGIGVDADQGYLGSHVMTSALKKVDVAVFAAISQAKAGKLKGGKNVTFDAKVNGVGYGKWSSKAPASIKLSGRGAVQAAEGRQDQGDPRNRQVDGRVTWIPRRGGPIKARPVYVQGDASAAGSHRIPAVVRLCSGMRRHEEDDRAGEARRAARGAAHRPARRRRRPAARRVRGAVPERGRLSRRRRRRAGRSSPPRRVDPAALAASADAHPSSHFALVGAPTDGDKQAEPRSASC